ncbi:hypothetical protein GGF32_009736 [Allomyces javanicus]|nr:hypothetical protein GGF32_009736 [Allomyces javanicus]
MADHPTDLDTGTNPDATMDAAVTEVQFLLTLCAPKDDGMDDFTTNTDDAGPLADDDDSDTQSDHDDAEYDNEDMWDSDQDARRSCADRMAAFAISATLSRIAFHCDGELTLCGLARCCARGTFMRSWTWIEMAGHLIVGKSWQTEPKNVCLMKPHWTAELDKFKIEISTAFGYEGMLLQMRLDKCLLYEPSGHAAKHCALDKEDRVFATVVLQPPSVCKGGKLLIYHNVCGSGVVTTRYDIGQEEGMAPFAVHYAAHHVDSQHEFLPVTSGFQIALVCSLCWPDHQIKRSLNLATKAILSQQLTTAAQSIEFSQLFFVHQYLIEKSTLMGAYKARFAALYAAKAMLPFDNRFESYLAACMRTNTSVRLDAATAMFATLLDRSDFIDNPDWVLNATRVLGA